jgi:hypothetical protein
MRGMALIGTSFLELCTGKHFFNWSKFGNRESSKDGDELVCSVNRKINA